MLATVAQRPDTRRCREPRRSASGRSQPRSSWREGEVAGRRMRCVADGADDGLGVDARTVIEDDAVGRDTGEPVSEAQLDAMLAEAPFGVLARGDRPRLGSSSVPAWTSTTRGSNGGLIGSLRGCSARRVARGRATRQRPRRRSTRHPRPRTSTAGLDAPSPARRAPPRGRRGPDCADRRRRPGSDSERVFGHPVDSREIRHAAERDDQRVIRERERAAVEPAADADLSGDDIDRGRPARPRPGHPAASAAGARRRGWSRSCPR